LKISESRLTLPFLQTRGERKGLGAKQESGGEKMEGKDLILEKDGPVAILTLNRPDKMNAINAEMRELFPRALQEVQEDDNLRALIITGAGRGFCSGADVAAQAARAAGQQVDTSRKTILALVGNFILGFEKINKPVIAAINGIAAGVGLTMTLVCDVRIASSSARFSAIWVKRGLIADGGATLLLPLTVGLEKALELCFTGEVIDAKEAERIRLVSRVVPAEELMTRAKELAQKIAAAPPVSVELAKRVMWEKIRNQLREQLIFESYAQNVCRTTQDQKEAVKAFMEKREPQFKGL
jgi:2-(1,2-epoxy-1,2-dihydrophenyl)acetyl-CoA isomerase